MNWAWLRFIGNILTNEAVMEPLIAAVLGYGISVYNKNRRYRMIMDITADVVDYIEEHYKEWGLKGSAKMEKFLEIFTKEFKKQLGRKPKKEELETAMIRAEALVQRARRASKTGK
ncbi:hypothetical protein [Thermosediminibacter litoriperuensis]|uniref:Uncharacterized protein n=1 Tax=Thermosediminibacter litoriperuensis TaxID=291989 RepID=A0A5S5APM2_9FIRM|nr:hypothetical protein [Thermosediminibacter litoriperuensis]TYP52486.1 hypothetical protein LZ11_01653 [Thermosediminibacter litoriperuensis]